MNRRLSSLLKERTHMRPESWGYSRGIGKSWGVRYNPTTPLVIELPSSRLIADRRSLLQTLGLSRGCDFHSIDRSVASLLLIHRSHPSLLGAPSIWRRMAKRMTKFRHHNGPLLRRCIPHMLPEQFTYVQHTTCPKESDFLQFHVSLTQV